MLKSILCDYSDAYILVDPNLGGVGGGNFTPCWFALNNSETVKAVTLTFCSIH